MTQYMPSSLSGGLPSTARMYLPLYFFAFLDGGLGLVAGGGHQHLVVVQRIIDSTTSLASGCALRMKLSEQQVHSSPLIQTTGVRGLFSIACAICGTGRGQANDVAVSEQYLRSCGARCRAASSPRRRSPTPVSSGMAVASSSQEACRFAGLYRKPGGRCGADGQWVCCGAAALETRNGRAPVRHWSAARVEAEGALAAPGFHAGFMRFIAASPRLRDYLHHNTSLRGIHEDDFPDPLLALAVTARVRARRAGGHARQLVAARRRRAGRDPGPGGGRQPASAASSPRRGAGRCGCCAARWSTTASSSTAAACCAARPTPADEEQADPTDFFQPTAMVQRRRSVQHPRGEFTLFEPLRRARTTLWLDMARSAAPSRRLTATRPPARPMHACSNWSRSSAPARASKAGAFEARVQSRRRVQRRSLP